MNYTKIFKTVENEFDSETAILVCVAVGININLGVDIDDLTTPGNFTKRLNEKTSNVLWEHPDKIELVIKIRDSLQDFEMGESFNGLGGCTKKTLKECMKMT